MGSGTAGRYIIWMPSNTCHRRFVSFPDKFTDPPVKGYIMKITWSFTTKKLIPMKECSLFKCEHYTSNSQKI